jgi:hypothetical protein
LALGGPIPQEPDSAARRDAAQTAGKDVNLEKLASQLRRDMAANPKKAAALGLMVAVALYCWGPLVWGWVRSAQDSQSDQSQLAKLILTDDPLEAADKGKGRSKGRFRWERVRPLLAQDPYMASATFDAVWTDPFGLSPGATEEQGIGAQASSSIATAAPPPDLLPEDLGLVLTSVAIGPKGGGATISGERYHVGDEIHLHNKDGSMAAAGFRVTRITHQGVEIMGHGKTLVLRLERPRLASGDAIERGAGSSNP